MSKVNRPDHDAMTGLLSANGYNAADEYNLPNLGFNLYVQEEDGAYVIIDETDYTANYRNGGCKHLVCDSDQNYYDKETDMYIYLNEDLDPPQFQYWLEGLSSQYGDYGWMEYDEAENALFDIVRAAFEAGWKAAKGEPLPEQNIVYLLHRSGRDDP